MAFPPTPEQATILRFAAESEANGIVNALAGTGKTTTIEMICSVVTDRAILYLAFNKRIVEEAKKRMPSHADCRTQNSLGHGVWSQRTAKRLSVSTDKTRTILNVVIGELKGNDRADARESYSDTLKWLQKAKRDGYVPPSWLQSCSHPIYRDMDEWLVNVDDEPTRLQKQIINQVLHRSIIASFEGGIDFDDQIYMPVLFSGPWPKYPLVLIDEAQDWGPLGHVMLDHLVTQRIIAVGDPWQSIYAFKGAVTNGMRQLQTRFDMESYTLSTTWRVPRVGVLRANDRVPTYRAAESNPEGEIHTLGEWDADSIQAGSAVICRNNAPLLSLGLRLLGAHKKIKMVGFDIGAGLVRVLRKLGPESMASREMSDAIDAWFNAQLLSAKKPEAAIDRAECLRVLCAGKETLRDAIVFAETLFAQSAGEIQLMSGHKSKGLEFDTVFHLDPWRIPSKWAVTPEAMEQELNLKYVIETRFKRALYLVSMEGYNG